VCEPRNARPAQVASPEGAPLLRALLAPLLAPLLAARAGPPPAEPPLVGVTRPGSAPAPAPGGALLALQVADAVVQRAPGGRAVTAAAGGASALRSLLAGCAGPAGRPGRAGGSGRTPDACLTGCGRAGTSGACDGAA